MFADKLPAILAMHLAFVTLCRPPATMVVLCVLGLMLGRWRSIFRKIRRTLPRSTRQRRSNIRLLQDNYFHEFKISVKASDIFLAVAAYQQLADTSIALHIGITEAGGLRSGTVKSAIGLGNLLWSGIGDTIRVAVG